MTTLKEISGDHIVTAHVPGQGTAATEDDWAVFVPPYNITVTGVKWIPNAAITANATNFFDLQLLNGSTVVASRSYAATNSVAVTPEEMTLSATAANLDVAAGAALVVHKETSGGASGLAMPDGTVQISYKIR